MPVKSNLDAKIYLALYNRLAAMSGGYDIVQPGETYPTAADTAFIIVQDVRFEPSSPFQGSPTQSENRGLFNLAVMTPLAWSHVQTLGVAGLVRAHFPKSSKYTYDDVIVEILETPSYVGNADRDEAWNRLPVNIRWRCAG